MPWTQFDDEPTNDPNGSQVAAAGGGAAAIAAAAAAAALTPLAGGGCLAPLVATTKHHQHLQQQMAAAAAEAVPAALDDVAYSWLTLAMRLLCVLIFYWVYLRFREGRHYTDQSRQLVGRVCIVTGANSGIGLHTARELVARGGRVIVACRDRRRGEVACQWIRERTVGSGGRVELQLLDLADFAAVRGFAERFLSEGTRLDILINNAGVMGVPDTAELRTAQHLEPHMGVNHYGPFLLTLLLLGRMRRTAASDAKLPAGNKAVRIVNVTSCSHRWVSGDRQQLAGAGRRGTFLDRFRRYADSKLANVLATRGLGQRLGRNGVTVNAVHPGVVHTALPQNLGRLGWIFHRYASNVVCWLFLRTPHSGSQSVLYTALDMNLDYITGHYVNDLWFERMHPIAYDTAEVDWFFEHSEKVVGYTLAEAIADEEADLDIDGTLPPQ